MTGFSEIFIHTYMFSLTNRFESYRLPCNIHTGLRKWVKTSPGIFHKVYQPVIEIWQNYVMLLHEKTMSRSGHNFTHATTADLLWHHVKNFISWYGYDFYGERTTRTSSRLYIWAQTSLVKWGQATACSWRLMTCGITSSLRGNYMIYKGTSNWILIIKAFAITFLYTENGQVSLLPTWFNFNPSMDI